MFAFVIIELAAEAWFEAGCGRQIDEDDQAQSPQRPDPLATTPQDRRLNQRR